MTLAATLALPVAVHAGQSAVYGHRDNGHTLKGALWGDNFYADEPAKTAMKRQTIRGRDLLEELRLLGIIGEFA